MWTRDDMRLATRLRNMNADNLKKNLIKYEQDSLMHDRIRTHVCKYCFYLGQQVMRDAFSDYTCTECSGSFTNHNGGAPKFCMKCAQKLGVCTQCGAMLTM